MLVVPVVATSDEELSGVPAVPIWNYKEEIQFFSIYIKVQILWKNSITAKHLLASHPQKHVKVIIAKRRPLNRVSFFQENSFWILLVLLLKRTGLEKSQHLMIFMSELFTFLVILCICFLKHDIEIYRYLSVLRELWRQCREIYLHRFKMNFW